MDSIAAQPRRFHAGALALGMIVSLLYIWAQIASAIEEPSETKPSQAASKPASTISGGKEAKILSKLDEILANQHTILQKFDAIMEELRIIKVRATPRS